MPRRQLPEGVSQAKINKVMRGGKLKIKVDCLGHVIEGEDNLATYRYINPDMLVDVESTTRIGGILGRFLTYKKKASDLKTPLEVFGPDRMLRYTVVDALKSSI